MEPLSDEDLSIGDLVGGKYEILSIIGRGSMGVVYKARHSTLGRPVAIKTLRIQRLDDDRSLKRFEREARTASLLDHPNIISVHDFGLTNTGQPFLVMDFIQGTTMQAILRTERIFSPERAVNLFAQVCAGLHHAHQKGVIHRDLKPANIIVIAGEEGESVKVVDLGVAKVIHGDVDEGDVITSTGEVCGSPIYLSPEQCRNEPLDLRSDLYALGVVMYECLCGNPPLRGATVFDTIYMHVHEDPLPLSRRDPGLRIPPALEAVVMRTLAKEPQLRQANMFELRRDLLASLSGSEQSQADVRVLAPEEFLFAAPLRVEQAHAYKSGQEYSLAREPDSFERNSFLKIQRGSDFARIFSKKALSFAIPVVASVIIVAIIVLIAFQPDKKTASHRIIIPPASTAALPDTEPAISVRSADTAPLFAGSASLSSARPASTMSKIDKARQEAMLVNQQGRILAKNGRYQEALAKFSEALALDPGYSKAAENIGRMHYNIGLEQKVLGRLEQAESSFRQSLRLLAKTAGVSDEKTIMVRAELVKILRSRGKTQEANRLERNF